MKNTPIFINVRDRLECLKELVFWLEEANYKNIVFIDNASTYQPLLEWLQKTPHRWIRLKANLGHLALYRCGLFDDIISSHYYCYTDPDIIPDKLCPKDLLDHFKDILEMHSEYQRVGIGLKIDDLPNYYPLKLEVIKHENSIKRKVLGGGLWEALVDTTFYLSRPHKVNDTYIADNISRVESSMRTSEPYSARHADWYIDPANIKNDYEYYIRNLGIDTSWSKFAANGKPK